MATYKGGKKRKGKFGNFGGSWRWEHHSEGEGMLWETTHFIKGLKRNLKRKTIPGSVMMELVVYGELESPKAEFEGEIVVVRKDKMRETIYDIDDGAFSSGIGVSGMINKAKKYIEKALTVLNIIRGGMLLKTSLTEDEIKYYSKNLKYKMFGKK